MAVRKSELVGTRRGLGRGDGVESSMARGRGVPLNGDGWWDFGAWRGCGVVRALGTSQMPEARRRRF